MSVIMLVRSMASKMVESDSFSAGESVLAVRGDEIEEGSNQ